MAKHIIYIPASDNVMFDGKEPYMASKEEAQRVIDEETVGGKKVYEVKPASFLKQWLAREQAKELAKRKLGYCFCPPNAEVRYVHPKDLARFAIVYSTGIKDGRLVKCLDTEEEAVRFVLTNIGKLTKEVPEAVLSVLDTERYSYVYDSRTDGKQSKNGGHGHGHSQVAVSQGKSN